MVLLQYMWENSLVVLSIFYAKYGFLSILILKCVDLIHLEPVGIRVKL